MITTIFLFLIGIILILVNYIAIKREKKSFKNSFDNATIDTTEYDVKLAQLRREFSETILELQKEVQKLKSNNCDVKVEEKIITEESKEDKENNVKVDSINELLDNGLSIEEVSEKLNVGKGEVLLIRELYKK